MKKNTFHLNHYFQIAVMNNSMNFPQYGSITFSGDERGDFIFIKKD